ncbi:MAG: transcriptional repressor [Chloroflexi bacterium]|nr:transcriptional repressor [Chloroflexota bacterium]
MRTVAISMPNEHPIASALHRAGHRLTPQRVMVLSAVGEIGGHVAVDDILARVRQEYPFIDVATVYRTVGLLKRLHLLNEVVQGGVSRYEVADPERRHDHLVCEHCGKAVQIPTRFLDDLRERLVAEAGFDLHVEHSALSGLCADCRQDVAHSHSGHGHAPEPERHHERPRSG